MAAKRSWNWQEPKWPNFSYDSSLLATKEQAFLESSGLLLGLGQHISEAEQDRLIVEALSEEALTTSAIEGEILNRDSVQSSLRSRFGLKTDGRRERPAEAGIAELLRDLHQNFAQALTPHRLCGWHRMLLRGRSDLDSIGAYREHAEPMLIISGRVDAPKVHFEAPPSRRVPDEMARFFDWYQRTQPTGSTPKPALTRAALVQLYFVCIHPFEDGNGRLARVLALHALSQGLGRFCLLALSETILKERSQYYLMLERNNKSLHIDEWMDYFSDTILTAQKRSIAIYHFLLEKTRFHDRLRDQLNPRQLKMSERMFRAGIDGFQGGMSAEKYISITGASRATATRDLTDLVGKGAMTRTGTGKGTRYWLCRESGCAAPNSPPADF